MMSYRHHACLLTRGLSDQRSVQVGWSRSAITQDSAHVGPRKRP